MIATDALVPGQIYFLAGPDRPERWRYVGDIPSTGGVNTLYIFADERGRPDRVYGVDLLLFHQTETAAWQAIIDNLNTALANARQHAEAAADPN